MQIETIVYIILSVIAAVFIAGFQYVKTVKSISKKDVLFLFLRFMTTFSFLMLLINPKFEQITLQIEKPKLVVAVDNSNSVNYLNQGKQAKALLKNIKSNQGINNKFDVSIYSFGNVLKLIDSLDFSEGQTNISKALTQLSQLHKDTEAPIILITDGNQTYGNDYEFLSTLQKSPVYPVILGDTIQYTDLKIKQINVNKYAYLKNQFPVEAIIVYDGDVAVNSKFTISNRNITVYSKQIRLTKEENSLILNFNLPANNIGLHNYLAQIETLSTEKNKINNKKQFGIEVIDQKTKIAIVSDFTHPDLGALKKSIETNELRSVEFLTPTEAILKIDDFQLFILYQQNQNFEELIELLGIEGKNIFNIIGTKTNLDFINANSKNYDLEITNQTEMYQGIFNSNYAPFYVEDIGFKEFPPLNSVFGSIIFNAPFETILNRSINGIPTNDPLLSTFEVDGRREAVLFGENIWQWRAQSFLTHDGFKEFDNFIGQLIQYLSMDNQKSRLTLSYETFYNSGTNVLIRAEFFDKNYIFDTRESLSITVMDERSQNSKTFPFILKNSYYQADLSTLPPSKYKFTVRASNDNISKSGEFTILEYNVEQQFVNANTGKLRRLAKNTKGESFLIDNTNSLFTALMKDSRYVAVQKSHKKNLPLVDWKYLLAIIVFCLSAEWFLRKYNGLI